MNHRDACWRWLVLGLRGLVNLIGEHAQEQQPAPELLAQLQEHSRRLSEIAGNLRERQHNG